MNWSNNHADRCTAMMHDCKNKRLVPGSDAEGRARLGGSDGGSFALTKNC